MLDVKAYYVGDIKMLSFLSDDIRVLFCLFSVGSSKVRPFFCDVHILILNLVILCDDLGLCCGHFL